MINFPITEKHTTHVFNYTSNIYMNSIHLIYTLIFKLLCTNYYLKASVVIFKKILVVFVFYAFMTEENALNEKKSRQKEILIRQHMAVNVLNIVWSITWMIVAISTFFPITALWLLLFNDICIDPSWVFFSFYSV